MKNKFEVNDRVRVVEAYDGWLEVGDICTITMEESFGDGIVCVTTPEGKDGGFLTSHFAPISDVESMTDQQLADEYRRLDRELSELADELARRGFQFYDGDGVIIHDSHFEIKKVETTIL